MLEAIVRKEGGRTRRVWLRELTGHDELAATGRGGPTASRLVLRLLAPAGRERWPASELSLTERDQLLVALHADCFGDRIESVVDCQSCGQKMDLGFSLRDLVDDALSSSERAPGLSGPDAEGLWTLPGVGHFRLPTAEDEEALGGLDPAEVGAALAARCVTGGPPGNLEAFGRALEQVAPLLDTRMTVDCGGCGAKVPVHFDIVTFFLSALGRERQLLFREVHRLAASYHWSLDEILSLPRSQRRAHVALIEGEQRPVRRVG